MAIEIIPQPTTPAPTEKVGRSDYQRQNDLINALASQGDEILTNWKDLASVPSIRQGTIIYHSGNLYSVNDQDEAISGSLSEGINYLRLTASGDNLTAAWVTSLAGYSFNEAQNGLYNGVNLIVRAMVFKVGSENIRGLHLDNTINGSFFDSTGDLHASDLFARSIDLSRIPKVTQLSLLESSSNPTQGAMFSFLSPFIPDNGNSVALQGESKSLILFTGFGEELVVVSVYRAERISSSVIRINVAFGNARQPSDGRTAIGVIDLNSGSSSQIQLPGSPSTLGPGFLRVLYKEN